MGSPTTATVLWWTAIVTSFAAQYVHWRVAGTHAEEWPAAGAFFAVLVIVQGATAAVLASTRGRHGAGAAVAVSAVAISVWAVDRSVGLPFGPEPWTRGTVGRADVVSAVLEGLTIAAAAGFVSRLRTPPLRVPEPGASGRGSRIAIGLGSLVTLYSVGLYAFAASGPLHEDTRSASAAVATNASPSTATSSADGATRTVTAWDLAFRPAVVAVGSGRVVTIELVNDDTVEHDLVVDVGADPPSGVVATDVARPGTSARLELGPLAGGRYPFFCRLHPDMVGRIEVS